MSVVKERHWVERAACKDMGHALFFPELGEDVRPAKEVCEGCPVRSECYTYSLEISTHHGIWGGKSERERRGNRPAWKAEPEPIRHGTEAGYGAHMRRSIKVCLGCRNAHREYEGRQKHNRLQRGGN